ncbi:hypothetical protein EG68_09989 [Paragonimus skrjabini miyazakii]|uniref:Uncharacterized protein n=1 Tax=Paragonimus skrjabini miyazakii TaxID=59628 RepID=A0A8S9YMA5_9TREM|nr:hypothetical protein EG68_09989 [Paragonimus skrjabini miyazakii]
MTSINTDVSNDSSLDDSELQLHHPQNLTTDEINDKVTEWGKSTDCILMDNGSPNPWKTIPTWLMKFNSIGYVIFVHWWSQII